MIIKENSCEETSIEDIFTDNKKYGDMDLDKALFDFDYVEKFTLEKRGNKLHH